MFDIIPKNDQTWLICGGRDFADQEMFDSVMGDLIRLRGLPTKIVHGGCGNRKPYKGADGMADNWVKRFAIAVHAEEADWTKHGRSAGPIRNQLMLDKYRPHFVIAFPGGRGTANMIEKARKAKIDVAEIKVNAPAS